MLNRIATISFAFAVLSTTLQSQPSNPQSPSASTADNALQKGKAGSDSSRGQDETVRERIWEVAKPGLKLGVLLLVAGLFIYGFFNFVT